MSRVLCVCGWLYLSATTKDLFWTRKNPVVSYQKSYPVTPDSLFLYHEAVGFFHSVLHCLFIPSTWKHKQRLSGPALTWFPAERFRHGQGKSPCPSSLCTVSHWCRNSCFSWRFSHVAVYTQYYKVQSECYWINSEWTHLSKIWQIRLFGEWAIEKKK